MIKRKGEVFTLAVVVLAAVASFLFAGSSLNPFKAPGQKTKQVKTVKSESKPIIVKGADGKTYFLQSTKTETSTLDTNEEPQMTLMQKLMMLPKLWLLLMVLGIFFPPIAAIMGVLNKKLMGKTTQIVSGVESALNSNGISAEEKQKILDALSKKYDSSTKLLVSKLKRKL